MIMHIRQANICLSQHIIFDLIFYLICLKLTFKLTIHIWIAETVSHPLLLDVHLFYINEIENSFQYEYLKFMTHLTRYYVYSRDITTGKHIWLLLGAIFVRRVFATTKQLLIRIFLRYKKEFMYKLYEVCTNESF